MKNRSLMQIVLFTSGLSAVVLPSNLSAQSQGPAPRVRLLRATTTNYESSLNLNFSEFAATGGLVKNSATAIVQNDTSRWIASVVLKWRLSYTNGSSQTIFRRVSPETGAVVPVTGSAPLLAPHSQILVSPFAELHSGASKDAVAHFRAVLNSNSNQIDLASVVGAVVTIDSIIYLRGGIVGPDEFGMAAHYTCERSSAIEEAHLLLPLLGDPDGLTKHLSQAQSTDMNSVLSTCSKEQAESVARFKQLYERVPRERFEERVKAVAGSRKINLVRLATAKEIVSGS